MRQCVFSQLEKLVHCKNAGCFKRLFSCFDKESILFLSVLIVFTIKGVASIHINHFFSLSSSFCHFVNQLH